MLQLRNRFHEMSRKEHRATLNKLSRRGFVGGGAAIAAMVAAAGLKPGVTHAEALANLNLLPEDLPAPQYKAATVEVGAASTWVSHGIETSKFVGSLLGVEVEAFDGQFDPAKQLEALLAIAEEDWDFVALHPASSDALMDGTDAIIAKEIPLVVMDTRVLQDPAANMEYGFLTFIEPDNIYMGSTVAEELFKAIDYKGQVIHTRGQLGHTGSQGRYDGFQAVVSKYPDIEVVDETPGEWQTEVVSSLWQDLLQRFPDVVGGFFHSDDMALAAATIIEGAGMQEQVKIVGVDGQKNACEAILDGRLHASVINPSGRIHGGATWAGYLTVSGTDLAEGGLPKFIRADGGPITADNAAGYIWLHDNYQY
ncbi:MAG TPA: sugar ABC transporter substrate-binding protein [Thermomicrobiales bacterium]|nr:sugar ABC transporter substrate-binding protein [Thermomicrobiales bacterium]